MAVKHNPNLHYGEYPLTDPGDFQHFVSFAGCSGVSELEPRATGIQL
jgi:hypothetical protein